VQEEQLFSVGPKHVWHVLSHKVHEFVSSFKNVLFLQTQELLLDKNIRLLLHERQSIFVGPLQVPQVESHFLHIFMDKSS